MQIVIIVHNGFSSLIGQFQKGLLRDRLGTGVKTNATSEISFFAKQFSSGDIKSMLSELLQAVTVALSIQI